MNSKVKSANVKVVFFHKKRPRQNQLKHDKKCLMGNFIAVLKCENFL